MPRVSIIIPAKNEELLLARLLESIKLQTYRDYEIIVADAHSTDKTREIAERYGAKVVQGGMPGPGRNRGASEAQGEFMAFVDADTQLCSSYFLEDCLAEMERKKLDVATCRFRPLSQKPIDHILHQAYNAYAVATQKIRAHASGSCILIRRHIHEQLHGFDERVVFAEDYEYVQRAMRQGYAFGVLRAQPIGVSVRRLDKDGRLSIVLKFIFTELRMIIKGPFTHVPFTYKMGGEDIQDNGNVHG